MSLETLGQNPAQAAVALARQQAQQRGAQARQAIQQQTGIDPAQIPTSEAAAKERFRQEIARRIGVDPGAIPTSPEKVWEQTKKRVENELRTRFDKMQRQLLSQLKKVGVNSLTELSRELAPQAAQKLFNDAAKLLKAPNIPTWVRVELPSRATVGAVLQAAGESAMRTTEAFVKAKTGVSIELPKSLNPEDLIKSIGSALPKDAKEALMIGVQVGIQYVSSALAGVIAGATIGSTIPGLGTVIGIGIGFVVGELMAPEPSPYRTPCEMRQIHGRTCPLTLERDLQVHLGPGAVGRVTPVPESPIEYLPWSVKARKRISIDLANYKRIHGYCKGGVHDDCLAMMNTLAAKDAKVVRATIPTLGLAAIDKYIRQYEEAMDPKWMGAFFVPPDTRFAKERRGTVQPSRGAAGDKYIPELLPLMYLRKRDLMEMKSMVDRISQLTPRDFARLQYPLLANEMRSASLQAAMTPDSADARQWLATVSGWWEKWKADQQRRQGARREQIQRGQQRFEARKGDPAWQKKAVLDQLQAQCGQDVQAACAEYRRIAAGGALTAAQKAQFQGGATPAPTRGPVASPRRPAPAQQRSGPDPEIFSRCYKITQDLVAKNPRAQKCLTRTDLDKLARICAMAYGPSPKVTPAKALQLMAVYADNKCKQRQAKPAQKKVSPEEQRVRATADAMLEAWLKQNPRQRRCVTAKMREQVRQLFVAAHVKKTIAVSAATQRIMAMIGRPC